MILPFATSSDYANISRSKMLQNCCAPGKTFIMFKWWCSFTLIVHVQDFKLHLLCSSTLSITPSVTKRTVISFLWLGRLNKAVFHTCICPTSNWNRDIWQWLDIAYLFLGLFIYISIHCHLFSHRGCIINIHYWSKPTTQWSYRLF